jgi:hypothetical protein
VLREPVSRLVSFFRFQQSMLHLPAELTFAEYVTRCDAFTDDELQHEQELNAWFGVLGGYYDRWLAAWLDTFGPRLRVLFADDLAGAPHDTMRGLAQWLDIDAEPWVAHDVVRENATTGYRNRTVQRAALSVNRRLEATWRRHPGVKRALRDAYRRVNAGGTTNGPDDALRAQLADRYRPALERTATQLRAAGVASLPAWLD